MSYERYCRYQCKAGDKAKGTTCLTLTNRESLDLYSKHAGEEEDMTGAGNGVAHCIEPEERMVQPVYEESKHVSEGSEEMLSDEQKEEHKEMLRSYNEAQKVAE